MIQGIKLNSYNASYEETVFDVVDRGKIYEIREHNSGISFFISKGAFNDSTRSEKRVETTKGTGERHPVS